MRATNTNSGRVIPNEPARTKAPPKPATVRVRILPKLAITDLSRVVQSRLERCEAAFDEMRSTPNDKVAYYLDHADALFRFAAEYRMLNEVANRILSFRNGEVVDWAKYRNDLWHGAMRAAKNGSQSSSVTSNLMQKYTGEVMIEAIHEDLFGSGNSLIGMIDRVIKAEHAALFEDYPVSQVNRSIEYGYVARIDPV